MPAAETAEIGGDFYDVIELADGRLLVAIGDVAGHSIHAATVMVELRHALRAYAIEHRDPAELVTLLERMLMRYHRREFATLCVLLLDPSSDELQVVNAGHLPPLLVDDTGARYLDVYGRMLGLGGARPASSVHVLPATWSIVLVTDGLVELPGLDLDTAMEELRTAVRLDVEPEQLCVELLERFRGRLDDIALLVLRKARRLISAPMSGAGPAHPHRRAVRARLDLGLRHRSDHHQAASAVAGVRGGRAPVAAVAHGDDDLVVVAGREQVDRARPVAVGVLGGVGHGLVGGQHEVRGGGGGRRPAASAQSCSVRRTPTNRAASAGMPGRSSGLTNVAAETVGYGAAGERVVVSPSGGPRRASQPCSMGEANAAARPRRRATLANRPDPSASPVISIGRNDDAVAPPRCAARDPPPRPRDRPTPTPPTRSRTGTSPP